MAASLEEKYHIINTEFSKLICNFQVFKVGDNPLFLQPAEGKILEISGGGLRLETDMDISVRLRVEIYCSFFIKDQHFELQGLLTKKIETFKGCEYEVKFVEVSENLRDKLIGILNRMELDKVRPLPPNPKR